MQNYVGRICKWEVWVIFIPRSYNWPYTCISLREGTLKISSAVCSNLKPKLSGLYGGGISLLHLVHPSNTTRTGCPQYASDSSCGRRRIMQTYSVTRLFSWCKTVIATDFNRSLTINPIQELPGVVFGILFCGAQMFTTKSCESSGDNSSFLHQTCHPLSYSVHGSQWKK